MNANNENPDNSGNDSAPGQPSQPNGLSWLTKLLYPIAALVFFFREPAIWLKKNVYDGDFGPLFRILGVIAGLGAGIGVGYNLGWVHHVVAYKWLGSAIAAVALTYFYAWPALCHIAFRKLFELSEKLWDHIDTSAKGGYYGDRRRKPVWFSWVLFIAVGAASIAAAIGAFVWLLNAVHAGLEWGFFGYIVGLIVGAIVAIPLGVGLITLINVGRVPYVGAVTGLATIYFTRALTLAHMPHAFLGVNLAWLWYVVEFLVWFGFAFPLAHIIISDGFRIIGDWLGDMYDLVYNPENDGKYQNFFAQAVNIAVAFEVFHYAFAYAPLVSSMLLVKISLAAVLAVVSYLAVGRLLMQGRSALIGVATAVGTGFYTFFAYAGAHFLGGYWGAAAVGVIGAVLTFFVAFPIVYLAVRLLAKPLLASWLSEVLTKVHKVLADELLHAYDNTYHDTTPYRDLFLQFVNLAITGGVAYGSILLGESLGLEVTRYGIAAALAAVVYLAAGKVLRHAGTKLVGGTVGLAAGLFTGVNVYALYLAKWNIAALATTHATAVFEPHGLWYAIPSCIAAALLVYWIVFTLLYVIVRAGLNVLQVKFWLRPIVVGLFEAYERSCSTVWKQFTIAYVNIRNTVARDFKPMYEQFQRSWAEVMASFRRSGPKGK